MSEQLIQINFRKPVARVAALLFLVLMLVWIFFVVKWYLGNTLAEYFNVDDNRADMAQLAVRLAPNDPLTHWRLGDFTERKLPPDQITQAVSEYEKAVSLSPNDYRFWMTLGRALEQAGEIERGEKALRRAVALAPSYSYPRWYLGNLLLRRGDYDQGFRELQQASEADPQLKPQLFNLAFQVFREDDEALKAAVGKPAATRAQFALYLLSPKQVDQGLSIWNGLRDEEKRDNRVTGEAIIKRLAEFAKFQPAASVWNDLAPTDSYRVTTGQVLDGGFEAELKHGSGAIFGWQVKQQPQVQIGMDPNVVHGGKRGLRFVFQIRARVDSLAVKQLIPVEPNKQYELEYYFKTDDLESAGTPVVLLLDSANGAALVTPIPAPNGDNDWQRVSLSFKTGPATEGVVIAIERAECSDNANCPMFGSIWYDDFNLKLGT